MGSGQVGCRNGRRWRVAIAQSISDTVTNVIAVLDFWPRLYPSALHLLIFVCWNFSVARFLSSILTLLVAQDLSCLSVKTRHQAEGNQSVGFGCERFVLERIWLWLKLSAWFSPFTAVFAYPIRDDRHNDRLFPIFGCSFRHPCRNARENKIYFETGRSAKVWQVLARLGMCLFLFVGWIPMLSKK